MDVLVSVIVVTYNSALFVLETLNSIKEQTYKNIELIVTDDCSIDNTIPIVKEWVEQNRRRFVKALIIESDQNTGISANCNRGFHKAQGEYVKMIAGDDLLYETCIEDNVKYITTQQNCDFVFSQCWAFNDGDVDMEDDQFRLLQQHHEQKFLLDAHSQFRVLLNYNFPMAPSSFIRTSVLEVLGGYDERFKIEDYPLWLKATRNGHKLHYLKKYTVKYRINHSAAATYKGELMFKKLWLLDEEYKIYTQLRRAYLGFWERIDQDIRFFAQFKVVRNENTEAQYQRYKYLLLFSPLCVWRQLRKRILKV